MVCLILAWNVLPHQNQGSPCKLCVCSTHQVKLMKLQHHWQQGHLTQRHFHRLLMQLMRSSVVKPEEKRGNASLWLTQRQGEDAKRDIKIRVIRHNTLLSLYHTTLHSSATSFKKLWEGTWRSRSIWLLLLWKTALLFGSSIRRSVPLNTAVFKETCVTLNLSKSVWSKAEVFALERHRGAENNAARVAIRPRVQIPA